MKTHENPTAVRSKDRIETALLSLMRERPLSAVTIREITQRAGLSRQTFYLNFADKDAVLSRCLERLLADVMRRIHDNGVDRVETLVETYTSVVEENAAFFRLLADNGLTGLVCRVFSARLAKLPPVLTCQRENRTEAEKRYFNVFWVAAFVEAYAQWLSEDMQTDRAEINRIMTDIMLGNYFRPDGDEQNQ